MKLSSKIGSLTKALVTRRLEFRFDGMPFRIDDVSQAKLMTIMRSAINCAKARPSAPLYPVQLQIEPSSTCMLKCPVCPAVTSAKPSSQRIMPMPLYKSIIDDVGDYATIAIFWMWGEPLTNPAFSDMVAYAHQKKIATFSSTNGHAVQTEAQAEQIVRSGLDVLVVALDGATQETYQSYRIGGDINKVFRCLELLRQAKTSLGSTKPLVSVRTVVSRKNEGELDAIEDIARSYGADMAARKLMCICDLSDSEENESLLPIDTRYIRGADRNNPRARKSVETLKCRRPWSRMTVNAEGTVLPCEFDFKEANPFGRVDDGISALSAWRSQTAESFRQRFSERKSDFEYCRSCTYKDGGSFECTVETKPLHK
ncbi:MAG TPA: radical SAM protein [Armatimonadota bacterium]|jgi:radical SAM protein with 4Fe4S-binding SPASM domain